MARVDSEFPLSGRHGNIVYYTRNGQTFFRVYTRPSDPKHPGQLKSRARLRVAGQFLSQFKTVLRRGYQAPVNHSIPLLEAQNYLMANCLVQVNPPTNGERFQFEVDIPSFKIARGKITPPDITSLERNSNEIALSWDTDLGYNVNRLFDNINLVAYTPGERVVWLTDIGTRQTGSGIGLIPKGFIKPAHIWVFYSNEQKTLKASQENVSDSVYLGVY